MAALAQKHAASNIFFTFRDCRVGTAHLGRLDLMGPIGKTRQSAVPTL